MFPRLPELELITYRAPLALHFRDAATGAAVTNGLFVQAWPHDPAQPQVARRLVTAARSPHSGLYGFRSLPGLERYTAGAPTTAGSLPFIVLVVDQEGRYLPQMRRFDLPLAVPAVQGVSLFPAPAYLPPAGFALTRGQLLRTTAPTGNPPQVTALEPAGWAQVIVEAPGPSPSGPAQFYRGLADQRGSFLLALPYPPLPASTLLEDAAWTLSLAVEHDPAAIAAGRQLLHQARPELAGLPLPPFQETLESQPAALLFSSVRVVDADAQIYEIAGPPGQTTVTLTLHFQQPLVVRTQQAGSPGSPLSPFLVRS